MLFHNLKVHYRIEAQIKQFTLCFYFYFLLYLYFCLCIAIPNIILYNIIFIKHAVPLFAKINCNLYYYNGILFCTIPYVNFAFQVLKEAAVNTYKSASNIVEEKMEVHIDDDDFNLPKPENLIWATNRLRQKNRPPEPTDIWGIYLKK